MVRQAIAGAVPPQQSYRARARPRLDAVAAFIDAVLSEDRRAPGKQRDAAHLRTDPDGIPGATVVESAVCNHVRARKRALGVVRRETFVPQSYALGQEAQVDW